jgi:hypothetical protein
MFRLACIAAVLTASLLPPLLAPSTGWAQGHDAVSPTAGREPHATSPCQDPEYKPILEKPIVELTSEEYDYITRVRTECRRFQQSQRASSSGPELLPSDPTAKGTPRTRSGSESVAASPWAAGRSSEPRFALSVHAGLAPPTGRMTDYHQPGRSFNVGIDYELNERLAIELFAVGLDHFPLDEPRVRNLDEGDQPTASEVLPGGSITMFSLMSGIRARPVQWPYAPYIVLGAGLFRASHWDLELPSGEIIRGESQSALGASVGGGFDVRIGQRSTVFTELRANFVETGYASSVYVPLRVGFRYLLR